ncbi:MAG: 16S rRNA (adenine(1518)-N(6)/adenine(1519)-N(6))-dimethyltransferase RsmA [Candidatus Hodarchaeota archaeon]
MNFLHLLSRGNLKEYTRAIVQNYAIVPKKALGQNFVISKRVVEALLSEAALNPQDIIVEIGGGIGTLTFFLLQECQKVITYEIDPILSTIIKKELIEYEKRLRVISGDFLNYKIPPHQKIISNLPYRISSPFIKKISRAENYPETITVTLQNEFANHLCANPGEPSYSRISVYSSFFYEFNKIISFPSSCFYPKPKVNSSLVQGIRKKPPNEVRNDQFVIFLTNLFCRKHKKVRNNLQVYGRFQQRNIRKVFTNELDKLSFASKQPINLSPSQILELFLQFKEILTKLDIP